MMGQMGGHECDVLLEKLLSGDAQNVVLNLRVFPECLIWSCAVLGFQLSAVKPVRHHPVTQQALCHLFAARYVPT